MPKYRSTVSLKRKGVRHPAGTDFTDLTNAELKELRASKHVVFVPPDEPDEAEGDAGNDGGNDAGRGAGKGAQKSA